MSASGETQKVEPLKFGEAFKMVIPSQAHVWEGVETRRAAPKTRAACNGEGIVQTTNPLGAMKIVVVRKS